MIYIFGGPGKTGSSAIANRLAIELKAPRYYGGGYMKTEAIKAGFHDPNYKVPAVASQWDLDMALVKDFRKYTQSIKRDIDKEMEIFQLKGMLQSISNSSDAVIEGKAFARFLHSGKAKEYLAIANKDIFRNSDQYIKYSKLMNSYIAVWLHSTLEIRAKRSLIKSGMELNPGNLTKEMYKLKARQISDGADYALKYGMQDFPLPDQIPNNKYGITIDSSTLSEEETYNKVLKLLGLSI